MTRVPKGDRVVMFVILGLAARIPVVAKPPQQAAGATSGASPQGNSECFKGTARAIVDVFSRSQKADALNTVKTGKMLQRWAEYVCYSTEYDTIRSKLLGKAEESRQDKQPGASSSSSGSTSLASKGSSPWLLGFALEHGGFTQTTDGNTITFRANAANSIKALLTTSYWDSYQLGENDPLVRYLSKLSLGISFDTSANQPSMAQGFTPSNTSLSGFSGKYEIHNHRDPRDPKWRDEWNRMAAELGSTVAAQLADLNSAITRADGYEKNWQDPTFSALCKLPDKPTVEQVQQLLKDAADLFRRLFWNLPEVQAAVDHFKASTFAYTADQADLLARMQKTLLVTVEYNFTHQLTANNQNIVATQAGQNLPDLSNINFVLEKGFVRPNGHGASSKLSPKEELTFNAGVTWFNSPNTADPKRGRLRDYRASLELDVPLKEIQNVGKPTLSFSGQFLSLLEEPLGQKVMVNGVTIDRRGNMGVFQTKLSIPVKNSGVKIPVSFTYASRTELIKERDLRGNIGITFDLDSVFSSMKR